MKKYFDTKAESLEEKIKQIFGETVAKEGNKFTKALMAARDAGRKFFSVNGKQYETEAYAKENLMRKGMADMQAQKKPKAKKEDNTNDKSDDGEGLDKVQPKAVKKKFADRKDKDIDNDGDVDSSDKYLHKRRKAISKAIKKEDIADKVTETIAKKNMSMREALAKVWDNGYDKLKNNNPFEQFAYNTPSNPTAGRDAIRKAQSQPKKPSDGTNPGQIKPKKPISSQKKTDTGQPVTKVEINPKV